MGGRPRRTHQRAAATFERKLSVGFGACRRKPVQRVVPGLAEKVSEPEGVATSVVWPTPEVASQAAPYRGRSVGRGDVEGEDRGDPEGAPDDDRRRGVGTRA